MKQNILQRIQIYRTVEKATITLEKSYEGVRQEVCRLPNQYLDQYIDGEIALDELKYRMMIYRKKLKDLVSPCKTIAKNRKFLEDNREMIQELERNLKPRGPFEGLF